MKPLDDRGVSSVIGNVLLVGIAVVIATTVTVAVLPLAEQTNAPPRAAIDAEERFVAAGDVATGDDWVDCPAGDGERALEVTLTQLQRADEIYVIVHDEDGERTKTVWSDPGDGQVGTRKLLINELEYESHWVDIGGGSDWGLCPGESATFRFYGEYEGERYLIKKYTVE